ncbi:MAG: response regulator [Nitriliruptorales bacterium]|nr:response regulator [Nitriliruptorales bacterium]
MARVLVCDDAPDIRELLSIVLGDTHDITTAEDGRECLERLNGDESFDALVLDVMMPELDGFEVLRQLRLENRWRELPVIMLTAKVDESSYMTGYRLGADAYVSKPFDPVDLEEVLTRVLRQSPEERAQARQDELAKSRILWQLENRSG